METQTDELVKNMESLQVIGGTISNGLDDNRTKIQKLVGVKRLLEKLEFLFELPMRLTRSIELEAYAQAVKYYCTATGVLRDYDHIPSFKVIGKSPSAVLLERTPL